MHIFLRLLPFYIAKLVSAVHLSSNTTTTTNPPSAAPAHMSPGMSKYVLLYADFHETNAPHHVNKSYNEFQPNWTINVVGMHTNSYVSKSRV